MIDREPLGSQEQHGTTWRARHGRLWQAATGGACLCAVVAVQRRRCQRAARPSVTEPWRVWLVCGALAFAAAAARFARRAAILAGLDRDLPLEAVVAGCDELLAAVVVLDGCLWLLLFAARAWERVSSMVYFKTRCWEARTSMVASMQW